MKSNKLRHRSLHPFQIIFDGSRVYVHRGLVIDVPVAKAWEVENATKDLRYEEPGISFEPGKSIVLIVQIPDPASVPEGDDIRVTGAEIDAVAIGSESGSPIIGRVENGRIYQELKSDFYYFAVGGAAA